MDFLLIDSADLEDKKATYKFPNIAAEILSTSNEKVYEYFGAENKSGELANLERLFSCFPLPEDNAEAPEVNFTRAGYVQKVLNNLINNRPLIFAFYILRHAPLLKALLRHSYCKSVSVFLLNLITLTPPTPPTANTSNGSTNASPEGDAVKVEAAPQPATVADLLKQTLDDRLVVFGEIIEQCVATSDKEEHNDLNGNFANLVMSILNKEFSERPEFLKVFVDHLDAVIDNFAASFSSPANNKLGNIFLIFLEILFRENEKESMNLTFDVKKLEQFTAKYYGLLTASPAEGDNRSYDSRTSSFPFELSKANLKIYKVLEAIIMTMKFYVEKPDFDRNVFLNSGFEKVVFQLFENYPFNSILHNQLKKYLLLILESNFAELQETYFVNNDKFKEFLQGISKTKCTVAYGKRKIRKGFVGQMVAITTAIFKNEALAEKLAEGGLTRRSVEAVRRRVLQGRVREGE